ncbi:DinB family protein [Geobacillus sp. C56-T2]|uniref:DinB family protein n=1 Tax=Geobacillus sp. C56-T2 TaxID=600773 RepID=UPI00119F5927|nr:DinB family protein [Geobacillus sp. C56-T2]NNV06400.1 DinB family protein [Geobacillus sp. MMMUD3]TWG30334.1 DinB family protein [Geobacillus sp. C56-T2]
MPLIEQYRQEIKESVEKIIQKVSTLTEEEIRWKPSADEWSIMEILCHVEEVIGYWIRELVRVIQAGGGEWGRGLNDEARLAAVRQADVRHVDEVIHGIREAAELADQQLAALNDEQLALEAPHRNPKFGMKPMTFLIEHFLTEHLTGHLRQIERNLHKYEAMQSKQ